MVLRPSGSMSMGDINVELGLTRTAQRTLGCNSNNVTSFTPNNTSTRYLDGKFSGPIRLAADSYNQQRATVSTIALTSIGYNSFNIPAGSRTVNVVVVGGAGGGAFVTCCTNAGNSPGGYGGYAEGTFFIQSASAVGAVVGGGGASACRNVGSGGGTSTLNIGSNVAITATGGGGGYFVYGPNYGHIGSPGSASGGNIYNGDRGSIPSFAFSFENSYSGYGVGNGYSAGAQGIVIVSYY